MDTIEKQVAEECLHAAYEGSMDFPTIVRKLLGAGFEGYAVDYRRRTNTYFLPNGDCIELAHGQADGPIAPEFRADLVQAAVREAQTNAPGYTYAGFCSKVKAAGCANYVVSFLGRRVVYMGRTAETHVELFPS